MMKKRILRFITYLLMVVVLFHMNGWFVTSEAGNKLDKVYEIKYENNILRWNEINNANKYVLKLYKYEKNNFVHIVDQSVGNSTYSFFNLYDDGPRYVIIEAVSTNNNYESSESDMYDMKNRSFAIISGDIVEPSTEDYDNDEEPTKAPTQEPTKAPTQEPTKEPTKAPTKEPTKAPTKEPTKAPTKEPTKAPTKEPTKAPTKEPTKAPTKEPTKAPTKEPTKAPTKEPTKAPTKEPTKAPTKEPTKAPTKEPTKAPTKEPTKAPTKEPTKVPTYDMSSSETEKTTIIGVQNDSKSLLPSISGAYANQIKTAPVVSEIDGGYIGEYKLVLANVSASKAVNVGQLNKFAGGKVLFGAVVEPDFSVIIDMSKNKKLDLDLRFAYNKVSLPMVSNRHTTFSFIPVKESILPIGTTLHFNIGKTYNDRKAFIFEISPSKKSYILKETTKVSDMGNVAYETRNFTNIIIMVE